jgi:DMSO/TMAO reductase YedYZ molybdopterin-dependent catalytic subunit
VGFSRRELVKIFGGVAGASLVPWNFRCAPLKAKVVGSSFRPSAETPLTPTDQFYINSNFGRPEIPSKWRLHIGGLVDRELDLGFEQLRGFESVSREITLECIGNSPGGNLISSALFEGVRAREVLEAAGLSARAHGLAFTGLDGYPAYLPKSAIDDGEALLVHRMNGEPLAPDHGAPVRVIFPGRFGLLCVKWLDSIVAIRDYVQYGALRSLGRFVDGKTAVRSRIDSPSEIDPPLAMGAPTELRGLAVSSGRGISKVEVQIDDGQWVEAELSFNALSDGRSPYLWTLWRLPWTPSVAGEHVIRARASDADGGSQDDAGEFPYDVGAIHSLRVHVVG